MIKAKVETNTFKITRLIKRMIITINDQSIN